MMLSHIFIFKQKTAYELRISDWSSDVLSSDLLAPDVPNWHLPCRISTASGQYSCYHRLQSNRFYSGALRPPHRDPSHRARALNREPQPIARMYAFFERDRKSTRLNSSH